MTCAPRPPRRTELADAYHMDEASATSRDVQRIAEKVRARLNTPPSEV